MKSKVSKFKLVAKFKLAIGKRVRSDFDARSVDGLGYYLRRKNLIRGVDIFISGPTFLFWEHLYNLISVLIV